MIICDGCGLLTRDMCLQDDDAAADDAVPAAAGSDGAGEEGDVDAATGADVERKVITTSMVTAWCAAAKDEHKLVCQHLVVLRSDPFLLQPSASPEPRNQSGSRGLIGLAFDDFVFSRSSQTLRC